MENYKFLMDESELYWYWLYGISPLKQNEIYFVSLSCRNKTLSEEEREYYKCGRSEMFAKQQIRHDDWSVFLQHVKRFEVRKDAYLTRSGVEYPQKSLVVYFNLVPIDCYKSMKDQMNHLTEIMSSLTDSAIKNSKGGLEEAYYKVRKSFDSCQSLFARNLGYKEWIDIDCDVDFSGNEKIEFMESIRSCLNHRFGMGNVMIVSTAGGYHCLVRKSSIKMNPNDVCKEIFGIIPAKEVLLNSNYMIPLPGTSQYEDHLVKILNKEDFKESDKLHQI